MDWHGSSWETGDLHHLSRVPESCCRDGDLLDGIHSGVCGVGGSWMDGRHPGVWDEVSILFTTGGQCRWCTVRL